MMLYKPTANYKLIYVYTIHDEKHNGKLKVGTASLSSIKSEKQLPPNCPELLAAAKRRIDEQTKTAMVDYEILHTELSIRHITLADGTDHAAIFEDHDIHEVLKESGYAPLVFRDSGKDSEWFTLTLDVILDAINAYKMGYSMIPPKSVTTPVSAGQSPKSKTKIKLRTEQADNIAKTISIFKNNDTMLWDCKMRYGKTVTAYELVRQMGLKRVIVVTHRPAVEDSWDTDHDLIFEGTNHRFIDKTKDALDGYDEIKDSKNDKILSDLIRFDTPFIYFASMQDLRGSTRVGGNYNKNNGVFDLDWEMIIIDEAHEGVQTDLGEAVIAELRKKGTKILSLTGTAYGLRKDYGDNVFTWTYVDEQRAKQQWAELHPNEKNPYADLPTMNILTFDLGDAIENSYRYVTEDSAFNFREFFRTWTGDIETDFYPVPADKSIGDFVHEDAVWSFLNLITSDNESTNYPFSKPEYVDMFKHTFWIVPGVKEAHALRELLRAHPFFKKYRIVDVAGDGDQEERYDLALSKVRKAIKENDKTITISCGRLTTGITVKEWTAVMMLSGSSKTSVNGYMQAIFRVQSPGVIDGKQKENCYVFDFAPDRALQVIADVHKLSSRSKKGEEGERQALGEFLNFCPVIAVEGTEMHYYDVPDLMRQIKRISVESAINSGFDDNTIYLSDAGLSRSDYDLEILRRLSDVVAPKKKGNKDKSVEIAGNGLTNEERKKIERAKKKPKRELTDEEKALLEKERAEKKEQQKLFDLLRAVSIRLPLLFYGADADITEIIKLKDFVDIVDDESWEEFMPKGLRKELFLDISRYYDEDVLVGAGLRIRKLAKAADEYPPTVRATKIVEILSKFKNPDKETVLTPWRVVNMHMSETLGGYCFFDDAFVKEIEEPRFVEHGDITADILLNTDVRILELNSKSGLYPLYMAYSIYNFLLSGSEISHSFEDLQKLWESVLNDNIFVLCKTKMARSITIRTLAGYTGMKVNAIYLTKLLERMEDRDRLARKLTNPETWGKVGERMKFDAVVGNPPYQGNNHQQIYPNFYLTAIKAGKYATLIFPTGWQQPKNANNLSKLNNEEVKADRQIVFIDNKQNVFPGITGAEWVNIILWQNGYDNGLGGSQMIYTNGVEPVVKALLWNKEEIEKPTPIIALETLVLETDGFEPLSNYTSSLKPYGLRTDFLDNPQKYNLPDVQTSKEKMSDIVLYGLENRKQVVRYLPFDYPLPKKTLAFNCYKVFVGKAWGNFSAGYLGGAYADIIVAAPNEICTENFLESGFFADVEKAKKHAKYLMTRFVRALLFAKKNSQDNSKEKWISVPVQDYSEDWWDLSIDEIEEHLFDKYSIPEDVRIFVRENIQKRDESNIRNI
ncbi:MAG: Eco57I restriction-modification methylase domain-containing protein [Clostridia bacterium]|nr:Eco57I restriction-modification methylase domain-containing protein [Clostridia bacterium]